MKKQKNYKNKFPKIYRFIPEPIKKRLSKLSRKKVFSVYKKILQAFTIFIFIIAIIVLGYDLYNNIQDKKKIDFQREKIIKELEFWQSFIAEHKDYRDAYLQLAILEYRLRNFDNAKFYLDKSLSIDPNFEKGRELEKVLGSK